MSLEWWSCNVKTCEREREKELRALQGSIAGYKRSLTVGSDTSTCGAGCRRGFKTGQIHQNPTLLRARNDLDMGPAGQEVYPSDLNDGVPNELEGLEEATPLVKTASPSFVNRSKATLGLGLSLFGLVVCSATWYCFFQREGNESPEEFTGVVLAELASCGRKLMWSSHPGMCAAAKGAWHGAELTLQPCGTLGFLDEWIFTKDDIALRARLASAPHFCMDSLSHGKSYPGAPLHVSHCSETNASRNQHFNLTKKGHVRSFDLCMDVQYGSSSPGTKIQLWHCQKGPNQHVKLMPCLGSCFKQVQWKKAGQCLTTAGWHLKEGLPVILGGCMDTHIGASQFKFRNSGGQLQLALNEELCVEVDGSKLHLAKCATGRFGQEFVLDGALTFGKSCLMAQQNQLQVLKNCMPSPEVEAFSSGCESLLHPVEAAKAPGQKGAGCPRQLKWSSHPELCIGTMQWQVGNGQHIVLALCEDHGIDHPRQHWLITPSALVTW